MKKLIRIAIIPALLLVLAAAQTSFADSVSGCTNGPNNNAGGTLYTALTCNLYPASSPYTIDLTPNLSYDGANASDNYLAPGYIVAINGDPNTLTDDSSGLWNQNLWITVLYWPGDQDAGTASDSLTVYYSGFPSVSTVQTYDENLFGGPSSDPYFFVQTGSYPNPAVYDANPNIYNIYTPEPSSLLLLGSGLFGLAVVLFRKARTSRIVLNS